MEAGTSSNITPFVRATDEGPTLETSALKLSTVANLHGHTLITFQVCDMLISKLVFTNYLCLSLFELVFNFLCSLLGKL